MTTINNTISFVKKTLENAESGHDFHHIQRVYNNALNIAKNTPCELIVVQLAALLHDIADSKFNNGDETIGPKIARDFLQTQNIATETIDHVVKIIANISFKGGNFNQQFNSIELQIVQDADRLDAIGAIGIARTFNYGGYKNNPIHVPSLEPKLNMTKEEYKKHNGTTINHFYEKLLLLKNRMNTDQAKQIAEERHEFMLQFLSQFYSEWDGEK